MKEMIQTLLKDRIMMDQFMRNGVQFEGVSKVQQRALRAVLSNPRQPKDNYFFGGWI